MLLQEVRSCAANTWKHQTTSAARWRDLAIRRAPLQSSMRDPPTTGGIYSGRRLRPKELIGALGDGARPRRNFRLQALAGGFSSKDPWQIFRSLGTQEMKHNRQSAAWNGWRTQRCWFAVCARLCRPPDASRCDSVQTTSPQAQPSRLVSHWQILYAAFVQVTTR